MISIIVAMTKSKVIGKENSLPWHLPEDMKMFKKLTTGNTVIMGRKTYDSIPEKFRPLPNRNNIVVSRSMSEKKGIEVARSIPEALDLGKVFGKEIFIIGGSTIYEQALPDVNQMYISLVKQEYAGNTYFPKFNENEWRIKSRQNFTDFELIIYTRILQNKDI